MRVGSLDLRSGDPIDLTTPMDDYISCSQGPTARRFTFPRKHWNSVINMAPPTTRTKRMIGAKPPSECLAGLEKSGTEMTTARMDEILETRLIRPEIFRHDDFRAFIRERSTRLLDEIELALGKSVSGRDTDEVLAVRRPADRARPRLGGQSPGHVALQSVSDQ